MEGAERTVFPEKWSMLTERNNQEDWRGSFSWMLVILRPGKLFWSWTRCRDGGKILCRLCRQIARRPHRRKGGSEGWGGWEHFEERRDKNGPVKTRLTRMPGRGGGGEWWSASWYWKASERN